MLCNAVPKVHFTGLLEPCTCIIISASMVGFDGAGGLGYDAAQAYHEARERGEDFLGKAEWKSGRGVQKGRQEGEGLLDSARERSREGWEHTKEGWQDLKDGVKSSAGTHSDFHKRSIMHGPL